MKGILEVALKIEVLQGFGRLLDAGYSFSGWKCAWEVAGGVRLIDWLAGLNWSSALMLFILLTFGENIWMC